MPLKNVRYRTVTTKNGKKVRLAIRGKKKVVEAKNIKTGAVHTEAEFKADEKRRKGEKGAKHASKSKRYAKRM